MSKKQATFVNPVTQTLVVRTGRRVTIITRNEHIVQIFPSITKAKMDTRLARKIWRLNNKYGIVHDHTEQWKKIMAGARVKVKKLGQA